ncbi:sugar ABC transporter permease [Fontimonas sp. SYSU GA230001]|uniref:carbohydrate ABC transporter permease n=1 Tax=Fontimonas sp. SYSU GA230001 TaxID=3142450 RepID=UPI0032B551D7
MIVRKAAWLIAPLAGGIVLMLLVPMLLTVVVAFTQYDGLSPARFVGLDQFRALQADPLFHIALSNSLKVAAAGVPLRIALALLLALLMHRARARRAQAAIFLPMAVPDIAWAILWLWIANPLFGPLAWLLSAAGLRADVWLTDPAWARTLIVLITLFLIGEVFIVLHAARAEIPERYYDVAAVEGAGAFTQFRRITLPLLLPALMFLAARDFALSLQTSFTPALIVTKGGPQYGTLFLPLYAYQTGFEYLRFGLAAAQTLVMLGMTLAMMALQWWALRRWRGLA